jgi:hypothetical protein
VRAASKKGALRLQRVASQSRGAGLLRFLLSVQGQTDGAWLALIIAKVQLPAWIDHTSNNTTTANHAKNHFEVFHAEPKAFTERSRLVSCCCVRKTGVVNE